MPLYFPARYKYQPELFQPIAVPDFVPPVLLASHRQ